MNSSNFGCVMPGPAIAKNTAGRQNDFFQTAVRLESTDTVPIITYGFTYHISINTKVVIICTNSITNMECG